MIPTVNAQILEAAWKRMLADLKRQTLILDNVDVLSHETALNMYYDLIQKVESFRLAGKYTIQQCPSNDAWETPSKCEEPSCVVSAYCMKHAVLYDDRQVFFTYCNACKNLEHEKRGNNNGNSSTANSVAFYYHKTINLCFKHQLEGIGARKKPVKRRRSALLLQIERLQRDFANQVYDEIVAAPTIDTLPILSRNLWNNMDLTPPTSPDSLFPMDEEMYYHDESLDLDVQEVVFQSPLANEDFKAVLDDVLESDDEDYENMIAQDQTAESLTTHINWAWEVIQHMESQDEGIER